MIILGVNGWTDRTHDAAAALLVDGTVAAFVEQERLSRNKQAVGELPHQAVRLVLDIADVTAADIDAVAYGWDLIAFNELRGRSLNFDARAHARQITGLADVPALELVRHHDAHAASSFYGSGYQCAAVLVMDAEGENESTSIFRADHDRIRPLRSWGRGSSLGLLYRAASLYCGFGESGAGKTMGLAAYGTPQPDKIPFHFDGSDIVTPFNDDDSEDAIVIGWCTILSAVFGPPATPPAAGYAPTAAHNPDAAASVQAIVETVTVALADHARDLAGLDNLCMAGGVALNCVANGLLDAAGAPAHLPPATHDAGCALGAALTVAANAGSAVHDPVRADLGPAFEAGVVADAARTRGLVAEPADAAEVAADLLGRGAKIGWFQGRMEVGPRALGHRSILAIIGNSESVRDDINACKGREPWRPLAPSMLPSATIRFFGEKTSSPFMLVSRPLTDEAAQEMPAAAHADQSARFHTVRSGPYRQLLEKVQDRTGLGAVLNTSFNTRGEPLVCSPGDALDCAARADLDAVVFDDTVVHLPSPR